MFVSIFKQKSEPLSYEGHAFEKGKAEGVGTNWETFVFTSGKITSNCDGGPANSGTRWKSREPGFDATMY